MPRPNVPLTLTRTSVRRATIDTIVGENRRIARPDPVGLWGSDARERLWVGRHVLRYDARALSRDATNVVDSCECDTLTRRERRNQAERETNARVYSIDGRTPAGWAGGYPPSTCPSTQD